MWNILKSAFWHSIGKRPQNLTPVKTSTWWWIRSWNGALSTQRNIMCRLKKAARRRQKIDFLKWWTLVFVRSLVSAQCMMWLRASAMQLWEICVLKPIKKHDKLVLKWWMYVWNALIIQKKFRNRFMIAWFQSVNVLLINCALKALLHQKKFVLTPINNVKWLSLKHSAMRKKLKVTAMQMRQRLTLRPIAKILSFMRFTAAKKRIKIVLKANQTWWC